MADLDVHLGYGSNEYGTRVSRHRCLVCGDEFTICPAIDHLFGGCQQPTCDSYDPARDAEVYFLPDDPELREGGPPPGAGFLFRGPPPAPSGGEQTP